MHGVEIGIDPVLLRLGPLAVRWYGLMIVAGLLAGVWLALWHRRDAGLSEDDILGVSVWGSILALIGARLAHVVDRFDYYSLHPLAIAAINEGGLAICGAVLGAILAGVLYARRRGLDFWRLADLAAPSLVIGMAIGRVGCTINGDAWGAPTAVPWGLVYTNPEALLPRPLLGVPTQPTPLYEIALDLGIFALLWALRPLGLPTGTPFLLFLVLYSVGRFFITFWREDVIVALDLRQAQVIALATLAIGLPLLVRRLRAASTGGAGGRAAGSPFGLAG